MAISLKNYYEKFDKNCVISTLNLAGNWRSGSTPERGNPEFYKKDFSWIKTGELKDCEIFSSEEYVSNLALEKCSLPINEINNVLIAMYGATIGKLGIAKIKLVTNQACCGCKTFNGVNYKYLFYYLLASRKKLIRMAEGGAQPNISREKILEFPFPLYSTKRQIKIAEKLDLIINNYF